MKGNYVGGRDEQVEIWCQHPFLNPDVRKMAESVTHRIYTRSHEPRCSQGANLSHSTAGQNTFSEGYFLK